MSVAVPRRLFELCARIAPIWIFACATSPAPPMEPGLTGGSTHDDGGLGPGVSPFDDASTPSLSAPDAKPVKPGGTTFAAYAHTGDALFRVDPIAMDPQPLGTFDCVGTGANDVSSMTDVAVNRKGEIFAISASAIHAIDISGGGAHCASTTPLSTASSVRFFALTFAPAPLLDPTEEVLVAGNTAGELWSIAANGTAKKLGNLGDVPAADPHGNSYKANVGKAWELSGDIVFMDNGGSPVGFATVRDCPTPPDTKSCNTVDSLLEIDMAKLRAGAGGSLAKGLRGQIKMGPSCNDTASAGYGGMYGIVAYDDRIFGFSLTGQIVNIRNDDATACLVRSTPDSRWAGAGITTVAPVVAPPH